MANDSTSPGGRLRVRLAPASPRNHAGPPDGPGLGTFGGVFTPSLLTILGVIMFLRFGWVVGQAGLAGTLVIVTIATSITALTGLSIAQMTTDQRIRGGGAYYIISRSLGPEVGGSVGIPLFLAQALSVALYTLGFAESLALVFPTLDQRAVALVTTIAVAAVALASASVAIRAQYFIMAAIVLALLSFFLGGAVEDTAAPDFEKANFWLVFAVFFPAVTGIMAGVNMSGDLKNPRRSVPKGTLAAIAVSYVVYMAIPVFLNRWASPEELVDNPLIMREIARFGPAILVGVWGATLSSAIGSILGAPRILQALARDNVLPGPMKALGRGSGSRDEPRIGTLFSLAIAVVAVAFGDLNAVAPILTMFFLTSYAVVNLVAATERIVQNPSFRPTFRVHWGLSAAGALGCIAVMLLINAIATAAAAVVVTIVYFWLQRRHLRTAWGDVRQGIWYAVIRWGVFNLRADQQAKTWRPHFLVLAGNPDSRWHLVDFASAVNHGHGFLTVAAVLPEQGVTVERKERLSATIRTHIESRGVHALVRVISAPTRYYGARVLVEAYGLGPLAPNTVVVGNSEAGDARGEYAEMIERIYEAKRNLVILRADADVGLGGHRRIDLWWQGRRGNGSLMITLAHLLATSPEWQRSELNIKMIVNDESGMADARANVGAFLDSTRIRANFDVFLAGGDPIDVIRQASRDADLAILGARPPDGTYEFGPVLERLMEQTSALKAVAYVIAAEDIAFDEILK